ncbi:MAG: T9SS type A sorting domain-containing protein, partial [Bacteroidales bacterium]|nr:T9SS type A sorting domain-containing protein [Bacteroidales bacterium]
MKTKKYFLIFMIFIFFSFSNAQIIELTYTGKSGSFHVPLDSILIENLTHAGDTMLYSPDTVIVLGTVGIFEDFEKNNFMVLQNYPNPFTDQTYFDFYLPDAGHLDVSVYNAIGKEISSYENELSNGTHSFTFISGNEQLYFLTVRYKSEVKTIKMTAISSNQKQKCDLSYNGLISDKPV